VRHRDLRGEDRRRTERDHRRPGRPVRRAPRVVQEEVRLDLRSLERRVSGTCAGTELKACFEDGRASASSKWTWRTGHTLELSIGKGSAPAGPVTLKLYYRARSGKSMALAKLDNL
jgi:hypothetical protein